MSYGFEKGSKNIKGKEKKISIKNMHYSKVSGDNYVLNITDVEIKFKNYF